MERFARVHIYGERNWGAVLANLTKTEYSLNKYIDLQIVGWCQTYIIQNA